MNLLVKHLFLMLSVLFVGFSIQWYQSSSDIIEPFIIKNYLFQYLLASTLIILFSFLHKIGKQQIGFIYLMLISVKFILVLVLIYPDFVANPKIPGLSFSIFFIPFIISTIMEVTFLLKLLKE